MSYRVRVATVYLLGFFIDLITMFICNVAYPAIARRFDAPVDQLAWISNGYIIGLTLVIPASSVLAQRLGAKDFFCSRYCCLFLRRRVPVWRIACLR